MKHICPLCQRTSHDGNLWCDRQGCPAGKMPMLMDYGDHFGNLQITQIRRVMHTATLYDAEHEGKSILLKVARQGYESYLLREVELLKTLTGDMPDSEAVFPNTALPNLIEMGKCVFRGEVLHFAIFKAINGDFLCDRLLHHPEPWYKHVGWFVQQLNDVVTTYHAAEYLHLNLTPETILVYKDRMGVWCPVLMDMGVAYNLKSGAPLVIRNNFESHQVNWRDTLIKAYASPKMRENADSSPSQQDDFYQMGMILYEMLASKSIARDSSDHARTFTIKRDDIDASMPALVAQWTSQSYNGNLTQLSSLASYIDTRPVFVPRWQFWKHEDLRERLITLVVILVIVLVIIFMFIILLSP